MSATIKYNGSTIASVEDGASVELDTQGKLMAGNVTVEAAGGGGGTGISFSMYVMGDGVVYYTTVDGVATRIDTMSVAGDCSGTAPENSLVVALCRSIPSNGVNLSFVQTINLGYRANYPYACFYQVTST